MDLKPEDVQTLQEQLILVYKFLKQNKMYKTFFDGDLNPNMSFENNEVLENIMEMEDSEDIIRNCIIELEEIKTEEKIAKEINFGEIIDQQDLDGLYHKYGMKNLDDVYKLDLKLLFEIF